MNPQPNTPPPPPGTMPPAGQAAIQKELTCDLDPAPPKKQTWEEASKNCITVDEFCDELRRRLEKRYADDARSASL